MKKVIGTTTTFNGTGYGFMKNQKVRIIAILRSDVDPDSEDAIVRDDEHLERVGGVRINDRVEVAPWLEEAGRYSWVTSDPWAVDLVCFKYLTKNR